METLADFSASVIEHGKLAGARLVSVEAKRGLFVMKTRWMRFAASAAVLLSLTGCKSGPSSWAFWRHDKKAENEEIAEAALGPDLTKSDLPSSKAKPGGPSFSAVTEGSKPPGINTSNDPFDPAAYPGQSPSSAPDMRSPYGAASVGDTAFAPPSGGYNATEPGAQQGPYDSSYPGQGMADVAQANASAAMSAATAYGQNAANSAAAYGQGAIDQASAYSRNVASTVAGQGRAIENGVQNAAASGYEAASNTYDTAAAYAAGASNAAGEMYNPYGAGQDATPAAAYTADARGSHAAPASAQYSAPYPDTSNPSTYPGAGSTSYDPNAGGNSYDGGYPTGESPEYNTQSASDPAAGLGNHAAAAQQTYPNTPMGGDRYIPSSDPSKMLGKIPSPPGAVNYGPTSSAYDTNVPTVNSSNATAETKPVRRVSGAYRPGSTANARPLTPGVLPGGYPMTASGAPEPSMR